MILQCDYCTHTASGTETDLLDAGWARITPHAKHARYHLENILIEIDNREHGSHPQASPPSP